MCIPTFVVGTGRCGSTMLSNMLREHPKVLSLSEFYGCIIDYGARILPAFSPEPMNGHEFWTFIAARTPLISLCFKHGVEPAESIYPCDADAARFSRQTGIPAIAVTPLPHLTKDHDHLFDVLQDQVSNWPLATFGEHYRHLFGWIAAHFGKQLWVERSGGMILLTELLMGMFPDARIVHVVRDGHDAAISMQGHQGYRIFSIMSALSQYLSVEPLTSSDRSKIDQLPAELRPFLPESFDADAFRAFRIPLQHCGEFWSQQIEMGLNALAELRSDRLLTLRYEDFFVDAKGQLDTLAAFLGEEFIDECWSARCAATVRPPRSTWRDLAREDARALTEACRPGFEALAAAGIHYDL